MQGITFGNIHSYTNLNLILSARSIGEAQVKTYLVDIPGADGRLDLTDFFGEPKYNNRQIKYTFSFSGTRSAIETKYSEICSKLNGKYFTSIVDDADTGYYWTGRCSVNDLQLKKNIASVEVTVDAAPYKLKMTLTTKRYTFASSLSVTIVNSRKSVVPTITTSAEMYITFNGNTYSINAGTHTVNGIKFVEGNNLLTLTGTGTVTFQYREGVL